MPVRRFVQVLALAFVLHVVVLPQIGGTRRALAVLAGVDPVLMAAGVVLEFASLAAYAELGRSLLPSRSRPGFGVMLRIVLSSLSLTHVLPGGAAAAGVLNFRLLRVSGASSEDAGFAMGTQSLGSAVVLNMLLWSALIVSIPLRGFNPVYVTAALVGVVVIGTFGGLVLALTRGRRRSLAIAQHLARRVPGLDPVRFRDFVQRVAEDVARLVEDRRVLRTSLGWASANLLLDAASLWVFLAAFGEVTSLDALLVAYGLANVVAAIPLTPGGLGFVEATLTATLVGFGAPRAEAALGVAAYRLASFWLPIPTGALAYLSLRVEGRIDADAPVRQSGAARTVAWLAERGMVVTSGTKSRVATRSGRRNRPSP